MSEVMSSAGQNKKRLLIVFGLTASTMVAEIIGGLLTRSLALLADAGHMMTDVVSLGLALLAIWFAERPATVRKTYGYYRVEILAALTNCVLLLLVSFYILYEAARRLEHPADILSGPMLLIAVFGLTINLIGMWLLREGSAHSLNVKGAYLEVLSDILGSVGVIVASIIIMKTGWKAIDPIISAGIGLFILPRTWVLLRQVVNILMEGTPSHINLKDVASAMQDIENVEAVHDLHVWTITSGFDALSVHVEVKDSKKSDGTLAALRSLLKEQFKIDHPTIQVEGTPCAEDGNCGDQPSHG